jgi:hypothetical protein
MENTTHIKDLYGFPGFRAQARLKPYPEVPGARIVTLVRRQKKACAPVAVEPYAGPEAAAPTVCEIWTRAERSSIWSSNIVAWRVRIVRP